MEDATAFLFPNSYVTEPDLARLLAVFDSITLCQPWFMESPFSAFTPDDPSRVKVLSPPESSKPPDDFKRLLSEYLLWAQQNRDKDAAILFLASKERNADEEVSWGIRRLIKSGQSHGRNRQTDTVKWHLILHLARMLQQQLQDKETMLARIKEQESPLLKALGEDDRSFRGLFEDLPPEGTSPFIDDRHVGTLLEAWIGLFGDDVPAQGPLVILENRVIEYIKESFENRGAPLTDLQKNTLPEKKESSAGFLVKIECPATSETSNAPQNPVTAFLSGKSVFFPGDE